MTSRRTKISPKTARGLGHVTHTILAVRSAILATAWLLVAKTAHLSALILSRFSPASIDLFSAVRGCAMTATLSQEGH